jgi:hypothetical protein
VVACCLPPTIGSVAGIVLGPIPGTRRWDRKAIDAALDKRSNLTPRVATVIFTTTNNTAWTEDGFRPSWGKACTKADIADHRSTIYAARPLRAWLKRVASAQNRDHHKALAQGR